jgi:hypothetical protein
MVLKPIWTYAIKLWGTTSMSNIEILKRFQPKTADNNGHTLVCTEQGNLEGPPNPNG